jgi:Flp pilus assembly protein TadB
MDEISGYIPGLIKLFVVLAVIVAIGAGIQWLVENPVVLVFVLAALGGLFYFWRKRSRARTMV